MDIKLANMWMVKEISFQPGPCVGSAVSAFVEEKRFKLTSCSNDRIVHLFWFFSLFKKMHRDSMEEGGRGSNLIEKWHTHSVERNQKKNRKKVHILFKKSIRNNIICRTIQ